MNIEFKNKIYSINRLNVTDLNICLLTEDGTLLNAFYEEYNQGQIINEELKEQSYNFFQKVENLLLEDVNCVNNLYFDLEKEIPALASKINEIDTLDTNGEHNFTSDFNNSHKNKKYSYALIVRNQNKIENNDDSNIFFLDDSTIEKDIVNDTTIEEGKVAISDGVVHMYRKETYMYSGEKEIFHETYPLQLGEDIIAKDINEFITLLKKKKVHLSYTDVFNKKENTSISFFNLLVIASLVTAIGLLIIFLNI